MDDFLNEEKSIQKIINLIQIAFNVWNRISNDEKLKNDIFIFFFIASCFIIIKVLIFLIYKLLVRESKKNN